jgi:hypothetical protein
VDKSSCFEKIFYEVFFSFCCMGSGGSASIAQEIIIEATSGKMEKAVARGFTALQGITWAGNYGSG